MYYNHRPILNYSKLINKTCIKFAQMHPTTQIERQYKLDSDLKVPTRNSLYTLASPSSHECTQNNLYAASTKFRALTWQYIALN